ncbi:TetR/AcrR family transcriptional regulator [Leucobacter tenebrionis]|uniref:TetR/AcrR family transcriptional regulator n=1 Tax=Leucobacter tenebrionis TaxID=2873270 RepID=UPI001CA72C91|nr:TetR/AcrR family transcriptional regulator [Leucobacter tenebrionis]QZY51456.1 TetR/AcrR family transcriptional regulator [Leucobacter tenebrionis]
MTDARIVRTRAALNRAIIDLATEKAVPSITVSELAAEAGINRVTFYKHFTTPAEALGAALTLDLDETRKRFIDGHGSHEGDPIEFFRDSVNEVLDHIDRHRSLYELSVHSPQDGTVPNLLADHFTETITQYLETRARLDPPLPDVDRSIVSRFFAHGLVGAIKAWLLSGSSDRDEVLRSVMVIGPDWWLPERP